VIDDVPQANPMSIGGGLVAIGGGYEALKPELKSGIVRLGKILRRKRQARLDDWLASSSGP